MRAYKFRIYPSNKQSQELAHSLWIEKNLWNTLLEKTKKNYDEENEFHSKTELQLMVKDSGLYSQSAQAVAHNLHRSIQAKIRAKNRGQRWGFPRFKSFERMKSIYYPQSGFSLDKKLKVSPFGEISIVKHREIKGQIKTLTLKRESSGKWFAIFTVQEEPTVPKQNRGPTIGLDLGLHRLAALSDGKFIENPHHFKKFEKKLADAQHTLSKKKKGSRNRLKAKKRVALVYEKLANSRKDHLHKSANALLSHYSRIVMEDLSINDMAQEGHGKGIHDASWGIFTHMLCYKATDGSWEPSVHQSPQALVAESAGSEVVFVDPKNTSKECSRCHLLVKKSLWERIHHCSSCGLTLDRDVNAAINILARATAGMAGCQACGDGVEIPSLNQETALAPEGRELGAKRQAL